MYRRANFDLAAMPLVGVGSVCRRQAMAAALEVLRPLHAAGLKLHGFGFKVTGLKQGAHLLASADSMAWSRAARFEPPLPECKDKRRHKTCANCMVYALKWREKVLAAIEQGESEYQPHLFDADLAANGVYA